MLLEALRLVKDEIFEPLLQISDGLRAGHGVDGCQLIPEVLRGAFFIVDNRVHLRYQCWLQGQYDDWLGASIEFVPLLFSTLVGTRASLKALQKGIITLNVRFELVFPVNKAGRVGELW